MKQLFQRPFLKWAGNKYHVLHKILPQLPTNALRLIEPFAGSGAVFVNTNYTQNILADVNADIISIFQWLQREKHLFIDDAKAFFQPPYNTELEYYKLREEFNNTSDSRRRALLFLYLNRHGYNGLCRYNQQGKFNVPFGRYKQPYFPAAEMLFFLGRLESCKVRFLCQDFRNIINSAAIGDVVYCDPPYVPLSRSADFTAYSAGGFSISEQEELVTHARNAAQRGAIVILSNHDTPYTRKLYHDAFTETFYVQRLISCKGTQRGKAPELLAIYS